MSDAPSNDVLSTLRDLRHVAEASGMPVTITSDNISNVIGEIEGCRRAYRKLESQAGNMQRQILNLKNVQRAAHEPPAVPVAWRFADDETGVHLWSGSQPPPHNRDLDWEPLYEEPRAAQPPGADRASLALMGYAGSLEAIARAMRAQAALTKGADAS
jgi:hypothetical protein